MEIRKFFVWFYENEDSIVVSVKDDVNRPNNTDCHAVLEKYISENYGSKKYDYDEIETCEHIEL